MTLAARMMLAAGMTMAGDRRERRAARRLLVLAVACLAVVLGGCGIAAPSEAPSSAPDGPVPTLSGAVELTRGSLEAALRAANIGLIQPRVPFQPPESPALADAPRGVLQAVLPDDPTGGYLVVYEFPDPAAAWAAGLAQAKWLASGPGAVQFPTDVHHVLRVVGNTLVTFSWSPASAPDPHTSGVETALGTVGQGIAVSR